MASNISVSQLKRRKVPFASKHNPNFLFPEWIREVVRVPPKANGGSFTLDEIRFGVPILDEMDELLEIPPDMRPEYFYIREKHWVLIKEKIKDFPWAMMNKSIIEFVDSINDAPQEAPPKDYKKWKELRKPEEPVNVIEDDLEEDELPDDPPTDIPQAAE